MADYSVELETLADELADIEMTAIIAEERQAGVRNASAQPQNGLKLFRLNDLVPSLHTSAWPLWLPQQKFGPPLWTAQFSFALENSVNPGRSRRASS